MGNQTPSAAPAGAASTRERLLDAAAKLFYEQGINVGVDAVCRAAGVSKRSMYQLFTSKDDLVAASLERAAPEYSAALLPAPDDGRQPRARILHVFERLEYLEPVQDFLGCPFVATAIQAKSPEHPASVIARRQKDGLAAFFRHEAQRGGAHDPDLLARQLTIVFDGASARSVVQAHELNGLAITTANALMDVAGLDPSLPDNNPAPPETAPAQTAA
ncbi:TetR/AcrR family transcriptional regulator [Micromonospora sp. CPCC 206061]|uniref:TetR/AcrR family transcriptional regulator n=1 Tax=Micromonospora sp. CPCC 206061 TaxID=3122410 RepID=UPI002FF37BBD